MELEGYIDTCQPRNVKTYMVTSGTLDLTTNQGQMIARIVGAVNRQEVDQLKGRVQRGLDARSLKGLPVGGRRPFGFLPDKVTHHPVEAPAIRRATEDIVAGESVHGIARKWRADGLVTTTGLPWSTGQLRSLLRRARNAGLIERKGRVQNRAAWEPIVSAELWRACVAVLDDPSRRTSPGTQPAYLGTFLYRCGALVDGQECRYLMRSWRSGRTGARIYRCSIPDRTSRHATVPIADVDAYVGDELVRRIHALGYGLPEEDAAVDLSPVTDTLEEIETRQSALAMDFATRVIPESAYRAAIAVLAAQKEQLDKITALPVRRVRNEVFDLAHERSRWEDLSLDRRRALVADVADVTILPVGSGNRVSIADRVRLLVDLSAWATSVEETVEMIRGGRDAWESENPRFDGETMLEYMDRGPQ